MFLKYPRITYLHTMAFKEPCCKANRMWQTSGEEYEIKYVKEANNSRHESVCKTNNL